MEHAQQMVKCYPDESYVLVCESVACCLDPVDVVVHLDLPESAAQLLERFRIWPNARHILQDPADEMSERAFAYCRKANIRLIKFEETE